MCAVTPQALPYLLLLGSLYGTTLIVSRFAVGQFAPTTYISLRFLIASLGYALIFIFSVQGRKWPKDRRVWGHSSLLGVFGTAIPMVLLVSALLYQSSGMTSILLTTAPAITVLMAHFWLPDESINLRKLVGIGLALGGAVSLVALGENGLPDVSQANPLGYIFTIIAMVLSSIMTIYIRKYMQNMDAFDVSSVRTFIAALTIMPLSILFIGFDFSQVNSQGFMALGYAAVVGTFFATIVEFYIVKRFGATTSAMTTYIVPVVASIGGVFMLGEQITVGMLFGMLLILGGIVVLNGGEATA
ncbi:MAG: DMT family transporter [Chloroflexi bacterium]|nr:DMT family transporter [Chloroflexota bacterium]